MEGPADDNEQGKQWTEVEAVAEIDVLRQQVMQGGSVDSENDLFTKLIIDIRNGLITPKEGVEKAHAIVESRQDYH